MFAAPATMFCWVIDHPISISVASPIVGVVTSPVLQVKAIWSRRRSSYALPLQNIDEPFGLAATNFINLSLEARASATCRALFRSSCSCAALLSTISFSAIAICCASRASRFVLLITTTAGALSPFFPAQGGRLNFLSFLSLLLSPNCPEST